METPAEANINSRYVVESVEMTGDAKPIEKASLRASLNSLIGSRFSPRRMQEVAIQLQHDLHLKAVIPHLARGSHPNTVRVIFDVERRPVEFEVAVPRFLYHSSQGFTGEVAASMTANHHSFRLAALSNGDDLVERFSGVAGQYESPKFLNQSMSVQVSGASYQEQWKSSTLDALSTSAGYSEGMSAYGRRQSISPQLVYSVGGWQVNTGLDFEELSYPSASPSGLSSSSLSGASPQPLTTGDNPARPGMVNVVKAGARYRRLLEGTPFGNGLTEVSYDVRVATKLLGSDAAYSRHHIEASIELHGARQSFGDELTGGAMLGNAPLFERFVLGTSSTLRGWNRYDLAPLGGNRMVHNSVHYGYQVGKARPEVFYDCGAVWDDLGAGGGSRPNIRHSLGIAYRQGVFYAAMAFPLREGHITPMVMLGMNY